MIISVPKERLPGENRVALVPDSASKLINLGHKVFLELNAGVNAGFADDQYKLKGVEIVESPSALYKKADIVLKVQRPLDLPNQGINEIDLMEKNTLLISFMHSLHYPEITKKCAEHGINVIGMEAIPRTTLAQKMDALSSQANLAGYKSVILAANELKKIFPLMMTAAGTIRPAKVVIMGAGVAGLQALGTAKRLGAVVEVSDIRPSVKEEVQSLGGRFIEVETDENMQDAGGYAKEATEDFLQKQKELIFKHIIGADIVITTALVPGRSAPILVTEDMVKNMRPGSVIVDMAVEFGGNCELSKPDETVSKYGVKIIGEGNLPSLLAYNASEVYSKNLLALISHIAPDGNLNLNLDDEIVKGALLTYNGEIINERTKAILNNN